MELRISISRTHACITELVPWWLGRLMVSLRQACIAPSAESCRLAEGTRSTARNPRHGAARDDKSGQGQNELHHSGDYEAIPRT